MESMKEIYQALADGRTVRHSVTGVTVSLDKQGNQTVRSSGASRPTFLLDPVRFCNPERWELEKEWYERLSETGPVLCKVRHNGTTAVRAITGLVEGNSHFCTDNGFYYTNATPLSVEEVERYLEAAKRCQS